MKEPPEVDWLEAANFTGQSTPGGALGYVNRWYRKGPANYVGSLTDYVARFYSPALGRFISADTIVPGAGNPAAFNRYMYVRGNPLRYVDPSGHMDASPDDNGATPGINDWPCGIENDCQMDWNNNAASRFGTGVLDEIGDALKGFFGLASAAANPASVIAAGFRAGSDFGANVASNGWESAISGALDDNPFIGAMRSGDYAYAGGRFIGFVSMAGLAGEFAPKGVCSFSPDTPVATEAGLIPIAGVITGTRVLAWDETANATGYFPVTNVWVHWDPVLVVLIIDGETITTTPEHPFYTPMHGWLPAGELWVGAGLRRADGGVGIVASTTTVTRTELMWNLTVEQAHTYFVSTQAWLVHNQCPIGSYPEGSFSLTKGARETIPQGARPPQNTVYRLLPDSEYQSARRLANDANRAFRVENGLLGNSNAQVHEIVPVKFGGDPVAHFNKVVLEQSFHRQVTTAWNALQTAIGR